MSDTTTSAPAASGGRKTRKAADHGYVGTDGSPVEKIEQATGVSYQPVKLVGFKDGEPVYENVGSPVIYQTGGKPGATLTMLAIFGAKTLMTNTASAARNGEGADAAGQAEAIAKRFSPEILAEGQWAPAGEGSPRGPRYDYAILAGIVCEVMAAAARKAKKEFKDTPERVEEKLKDDRSFFNKVKNHAGIMAKYRMAVGGATTDEDLLD